MKKTLKKLLTALILLLLLFVLFAAVWVFFLFPRFVAPEAGTVPTETGPARIAEEYEKIDFNESNGVLYVNNEVVVFVKPSAAEEKVSALFASLEAEVDASMADIRVYRLVFPEAMTYEDLQSLVRKINSSPLVENACINTVAELESDILDPEEDFDCQAPLYPNDSWNSAVWNVDVPRGSNWGVEAIDAPGAWGYLDRMTSVRIGLIDSMPDIAHQDLPTVTSSCLFIDDNTGLVQTNKYTMAAANHGTHVSGTMNARWDNTHGLSGVMGGKGELYHSAVYYDSNGSLSSRYATSFSYLLALKTLIDQDVRVINISQNTSRLIGFAASHGNQNAINHLTQHAGLTQWGLSRIIAAREAADKPDFVLCVAAGNSNSTYYYKDSRAVFGYRENMTLWERFLYLFGWRGEQGNSLALYNNFLNLMDAEAVKSRVIVVGAVGIDSAASTQTHTQYSYANFSNVGSRVDVVAPGVNVYSCVVGGYDSYSGTSMAAPHASGVAGLIFACNPSLSGPEAKQILLASATGRYYHGREYSGMVNANNAVVTALKTLETPVEKILKTEVINGLDLCFVVDTTGSMEDDIQNAKDNMASILDHLAGKTENYRVALIDYRDYSTRSGDSRDYPCKLQMDFTDSNAAIIDGIHSLKLGNGGDDEETVYSALMSAVALDWREDAKKVIIILGDAAPLDPEPTTNYTYDDVLLALFHADIAIDYDASDHRVVEAPDESLINVFSIGTDASYDAADFFRQISAGTGGSYAGVDEASKVSDAIIESIDRIEVAQTVTAAADFGDAMANQAINLYSGTDYLFTMETDSRGQLTLEAMEADTYRWTSNSLYGGGSLDIDARSRKAEVRVTKDYWFTPLLQLWHQHSLPICMAFLGYLVLCIAVPVTIKKICRHVQKRKASADAVPAPQLPRETDRFFDVPLSEEADLLCPVCGTKAAAQSRFCKQCGFPLQTPPAKPKEHICRVCGNLCLEKDAFCVKCGTKIEQDSR